MGQLHFGWKEDVDADAETDDEASEELDADDPLAETPPPLLVDGAEGMFTAEEEPAVVVVVEAVDCVEDVAGSWGGPATICPICAREVEGVGCCTGPEGCE